MRRALASSLLVLIAILGMAGSVLGNEPSNQPSAQPSASTSSEPSSEPSTEPSVEQSTSPSTEPSEPPPSEEVSIPPSEEVSLPPPTEATCGLPEGCGTLPPTDTEQQPVNAGDVGFAGALALTLLVGLVGFALVLPRFRRSR
jgi:cytoskeletal protein RodZ